MDPFFRLTANSVRTSFYRGGTSRGLVFKNSWLAGFAPAVRDEVICSIMGSPDPDGRQIDGVGGGASSLSKTAIVSRSGTKIDRTLSVKEVGLPGPRWIAEDVDRVRRMSDVVYRFGQVSIKERSIDWGSTCGNMVAAVAQFAIDARLVRPDRLPPSPLSPSSPQTSDAGRLASYNVRILAHDSGKVVNALIPLEWDATLEAWTSRQDGTAQIAGVPGKAPGILIETPLRADGQERESVLSTGRERDIVELDGESIEVTIVDTGLPVIFVNAPSISVSIDTLRKPPSELDADRPLMEKLERIRKAASQLTPALAAKYSPPAPKICLIHPAIEYITTGGQTIEAYEMDLLIRTVSVGQLHRTIPATTLSALAAARCFAGSVVRQTMAQSHGGDDSYVAPDTKLAVDEYLIAKGTPSSDVTVQAITVGQPAGLSTASVLTKSGEPEATVLLRTARQIMAGRALLPSHLERDVDITRILSKGRKENEEGNKEIDKMERKRIERGERRKGKKEN